MRKIGVMLGAGLVALLVSFSLRPIVAFAKHEMGMSDMIGAAKTPADHQKLAAHYEQEAKAARAKAEEHKMMADAYRKAGGPLIEKLHFDQHCDALSKSYASMADEFEALAKAEREAAKEMKK
jgi:hypothetical protein